MLYTLLTSAAPQGESRAERVRKRCPQPLAGGWARTAPGSHTPATSRGVGGTPARQLHLRAMLPAPSSLTRLSSGAQPHWGAGRVTVTPLSPPCWRPPPPPPQESSTSWSHFACEEREGVGRAESQAVRGRGRTSSLRQSCGARARPQPDRLVEPHGCGFCRSLPDPAGVEGGSRAPGTSRPSREHRAPRLQALPRGPSAPTPSPGALPATPLRRTAVAWGGGGG